MTERSVTHATFTVERTYDASPARVFNAFADPAIKRRWLNDLLDGRVTRSRFDRQRGNGHRDRLHGARAYLPLRMVGNCRMFRKYGRYVRLRGREMSIGAFSTVPQFLNLLAVHASDARYYRTSNAGVACPCQTPEGFRDPQWHLQHPAPKPPLCN